MGLSSGHVSCCLSEDFLKKAVEKTSSSRKNIVRIKVESPVVRVTCQACDVYLTAIETLAQLRLNILAGTIPQVN